MDATLSSEALTKALAEVKSRIRDGRVAANSRDIPEKAREVIASSYARFKTMMNEIVGHLGMSSKGLHLKMGRYAPNGKYKPHLWCAIIPVTVRAPSYFTTQLYIFRSDTMLAWGIGPSDIAQENEEFMAAYRGAMKSNETIVRELFSQGFVSRGDFEERQGRHDKRFSDDVSAFFGSNSQTLARVFLTKELPSDEKLPSMIEGDLKRLLPLYVKIVEACTSGNLIQRLNQAENDEDSDVEDVPASTMVAGSVGTSSKGTLKPTEPLTMDQLVEATAKTKAFIEAVERRLSEKKQVILFGPPGTSKTHFARLFARYFHGGSSVMTSIQFHPSYSYEDFIEGYRPNGTQFEVKPGVFMEFCESARNDPDRRYVFLIDEVNRGNLAQIFGELLYLLEYRDEEAVLAYSKQSFSIPKNVYFVATMNSADRSIAMVDYALRRRFDFIELPADEIVLREYLKKHECAVPVEKVIELFKRVNSAVTSELGKHYAVGHTYFMKPNLTEEKLRDTWKYSVGPLLEEYFYSNARLLESLTFEALWSGGQGESKVA